MSRDELSLFSYEILGLVGRSGAGAHDLLRWARRGRMLAWAGESQYYVEPKRLADKGLAALREYAATPATFTPLKSDPLLRLLLADLVGEEVTRNGLVALRRELAELHERLDESEETAATLPHRSRYLLLVLSFLRRYLDLHAELVDEVERELGGGDAVPVSPRS
jgi:hypothetical protein